MKVHLRGKPRQFSYTEVTCADTIMIEMLNCVPDSLYVFAMQDIKSKRGPYSYSNPIYSFLSGTKLLVGSIPNEYLIYGELQNGADVYAAIEELKMLDALRIAKKHFVNLKGMGVIDDSFKLRVTRY